MNSANSSSEDDTLWEALSAAPDASHAVPGSAPAGSHFALEGLVEHMHPDMDQITLRADDGRAHEIDAYGSEIVYLESGRPVLCRGMRIAVIGTVIPLGPLVADEVRVLAEAV